MHNVDGGNDHLAASAFPTAGRTLMGKSGRAARSSDASLPVAPRIVSGRGQLDVPAKRIVPRPAVEKSWSS